MFIGNKFCSHCGEPAVAVKELNESKCGNCPRCKIVLEFVKIGSNNIRECNKCGGFWTSPDTFENICATQEERSAVLNFIGSDAHPDSHPAVINYVPCPDCSQLMNRSNFARSSGVIIDMCRQHGVWFDADELSKIIDFINKGGLSRAREKEKISIDDERRKLRDDQRRITQMESRSGGGRFENGDSSPILSGILKIFFD
jgi:Zn-finger nucleic acid-binding protein